jgi:hypothetical protein
VAAGAGRLAAQDGRERPQLSIPFSWRRREYRSKEEDKSSVRSWARMGRVSIGRSTRWIDRTTPDPEVALLAASGGNEAFSKNEMRAGRADGHIVSQINPSRLSVVLQATDGANQ